VGLERRGLAIRSSLATFTFGTVLDAAALIVAWCRQAARQLAIGVREDRPDYDYLDGEQDLDLMASLNLDAYRFSISWSPCTGTGRAGFSVLRVTPEKSVSRGAFSEVRLHGAKVKRGRNKRCLVTANRTGGKQSPCEGCTPEPNRLRGEYLLCPGIHHVAVARITRRRGHELLRPRPDDDFVLRPIRATPDSCPSTS